MPTLAELVKFKNDLRDTIDNLSLESEILEKTRLVDTIKCRHEITNYHQDIEQYLQVYQNLLAKNNDIIVLIQNTIQKIDNDINQILEDKKDEHNIQFVEENMTSFLSTNNFIENIICTRISKYSDWRYPGLQLHCRYFRPGNPPTAAIDRFVNPLYRINSMVGCDPLYLIGPDKFHLNEIITSYPDEYKRRLRLYEIHNKDFTALPHAQFGLILCWDFFNYLTIDSIVVYLKKIVTLLRPGGVCIFSYNNCVKEGSARLVDEKLASWATLSAVKQVIIHAGLDIISFSDLESNDDSSTWVSWIEVQKPGELHSVKKSQAIGKILTK